MSYTISDNSIDHEWAVDATYSIRFLLRDLRRERTGMHGRAAIALGGKILRYDTFNLGRAEERTRLSSGAHKLMPRDIQELAPAVDLAHQLDMVCLFACNEWENERVSIIEVDPGATAPQRVLVLPPHVEIGSGTIIFGVPSAGKSWLLALMAVSLASGEKTLWAGPRRTPCIYVDLERNDAAFQRRLSQIGAAMGRALPRIPYLKARGLGLSSLQKKLREWVKAHPGAIPLYDSISRMGGGSLVEDETANAMIDTANAVSETWVALGHSPRGDASHIFGSQLWDAGADMIIKLTSEKRGNKLGCALAVTKANHAGIVPTISYELLFGEHGLSGFGTADARDWPELTPNLPDLLAMLLDADDFTATQLAAAAKVPRNTVIDNLDRDPRFKKLPKDGREVFYGLASRHA